MNRPVLILGSLDGIETGVRQLIRAEPLETTTVPVGESAITVPTDAEILRIKGFLLLRRNATRDYVDFAALAHRLGDASVATAFERFDRLYPQESGESALQQMLAQLASPQPYDLEGTILSEYNNLHVRWHDWNAIRSACAQAAIAIFEHRCALEEPPHEIPPADSTKEIDSSNRLGFGTPPNAHADPIRAVHAATTSEACGLTYGGRWGFMICIRMQNRMCGRRRRKPRGRDPTAERHQALG